MKLIKFTSLFLFTAALTNCSSDRDDRPTPIDPVVPEKTVFSFTYNNSYKINDITLYRGPKGVKETSNEEYLKSIWEYYTEPEWTKVIIDLKKETIYFSKDKTQRSYKLKLSNDSVFGIDDVNRKTYMGVFKKTKPELKLDRSFVYLQRMPRFEGDAFKASRTSSPGVTQYKDHFGKEYNYFNAPADLTMEKDQVFWANLTYGYSEDNKQK